MSDLCFYFSPPYFEESYVAEVYFKANVKINLHITVIRTFKVTANFNHLISSSESLWKSVLTFQNLLINSTAFTVISYLALVWA